MYNDCKKFLDLVNPLRQTMTWKEIGELLGYNYNTLRRQHSECSRKYKEQANNVQFETINKIKNFANSYKRFSNSAAFPINVGDIICITSDWHIGLKSVDYGQLEKDVKSWIDNNVYVIINGDIVENGIGTQGTKAATEQLISPKLQHNVARDIVRSIGDKLLVATQGNHLERSERVLFETIDYIYNDNTAIFGNKGIVSFDVAGEDMELHLFVGHKMPGATELNYFGAHMKVLNTYPFINASAIGHVHTWNYAEVFKYNKYVHFMTGGTYCRNEEYSVRFYNPIGNRVNHYLVVDEDSFKHFNSLEDAIIWRDNK